MSCLLASAVPVAALWIIPVSQKLVSWHGPNVSGLLQGAVAGCHMIQAFHKAGLPPGVVNLVTGIASPCEDVRDAVSDDLQTDAQA